MTAVQAARIDNCAEGERVIKAPEEPAPAGAALMSAASLAASELSHGTQIARL